MGNPKAMMKPFSEWLARSPAGPKPKRPIRRRTPERAKQERQYNKRVKEYLLENPICKVWMKENGISDTTTANFFSILLDAPRSTQVHHMNKRRGKMLLDERYWLAVCDDAHDRIESNLSWARENGYSLNF